MIDAIAQARADTQSRATKLLLFCIGFGPLAWFLGLHFAYFQVIGIAAAVVLLSSRHVVFAPLALAPTLYAAWYGLSIILNSPGAEPDRMLAAIYNASYWIMGAGVVLVAAGMPWRSTREKLNRTFVFVGVALGGISIVSLIGWNLLGWRSDFSVPTLFSLMAPSAGSSKLFSHSTTLNFMSADWLRGELVPRVNGFAPYPTATAALTMFAIPFLIGHNPDRKRSARILAWLALLGCLAGFVLTNSRTIWIAMIVASLVSYAAFRRVLVPTAFAIFVVVVLAAPFADEIIGAIIESRAGSSHARLSLYMAQIDLVVRQQPFIGMGIKERVDQFAIPLGSHSTVLGALYKTGTIGLLLVLVMMVSVTIFWFRSMSRVKDQQARAFLARLGVPLLGMNLFLLTEDIDAPQMLCFLYFLYQGLMIAVLSDHTAGGSPIRPTREAIPLRTWKKVT